MLCACRFDCICTRTHWCASPSQLFQLLFLPGRTWVLALASTLQAQRADGLRMRKMGGSALVLLTTASCLLTADYDMIVLGVQARAGRSLRFAGCFVTSERLVVM